MKCTKDCNLCHDPCHDGILSNARDRLLKGDISVIDTALVVSMNAKATEFLLRRDLHKYEVHELRLMIEISNILDNNTNLVMLPLENGVYDLLLELYRSYEPNIPVGAKPVNFDEYETPTDIKPALTSPFTIMERTDLLFEKDLIGKSIYNFRHLQPAFSVPDTSTNVKLTKRIVGAVQHAYPELAGTLDKCKFVLNVQAEEKGVLSDQNVKIFERDFLLKHLMAGLINPDNIELIAELKYDGIAVESTVSTILKSARTRGDTSDQSAADLTPILFGIPFPNTFGKVADMDEFGVQFEAIMTYDNLHKFNSVRTDRSSSYKNARTAIIGLTSNSEAYQYRDFITLVPLSTSLDIDRVDEIEFLNKYYANEEPLRYSVIKGNYNEVLFMVKRFVEESEYMRQFMPFMYDGVVISYRDNNIRKELGRKNSINQYSVAIKFNALKRQTTFRGYTFTIGQDGIVTPMIHYDPVEFYGTIHPKSTGHSYERFKTLDLRVGDIIDVEYVNDVMPYVTKPDNSFNSANSVNPPVAFPIRCPECENELVISTSGKSSICTNTLCPGRTISRMVNMAKKLNLYDFGEGTIRKLSKLSLTELLDLSMDDLMPLINDSSETSFGPLSASNLLAEISSLKNNPIEDYKIIGSLGFSGMGRTNWQKVLKTISLDEIISMPKDSLYTVLVNIKGIGKAKATAIVEEFNTYYPDLITISKMKNVVITKGATSGKKVRFTGVRDSNLCDQLIELGFDCDPDAGVTRDTMILIVPSPGFTSRKTALVSQSCIIVPIEDMRYDPRKYL